jgi:gliding motility-associated-like protein
MFRRSLILIWLLLPQLVFAQDSIPCAYPIPDPPFLEATLCEGESVFFSIPDSTGIYFQWQDTSAGAQRRFYRAGMYALRMGNGCDIREYQIFISRCDQEPYVPTAFSPNGDGVNDLFRARGPDLKWILLEVFNRKGERVFMGKELSAFWNGMVNGIDAPAGVYMWRLSAGMLSGRSVEQKGELVLIR